MQKLFKTKALQDCLCFFQIPALLINGFPDTARNIPNFHKKIARIPHAKVHPPFI